MLDAAPGRLPILGEVFTAELTNVPSNALAVGITGLSTTFWPALGIPLPVDLTVIGMPGCFQFTETRRATTIIVAGGAGFINLTLPNAPEWIGRSFYQQVFVVDPTVLGLGAIMSNPAEGVIGALPDLVVPVGSPIVTPLSVPAGLGVTLSALTLVNLGHAAAGSFVTVFYLSTDSIITTADTAMGSVSVPGIPAIGSITLPDMSLTIPANTSPGSYWIGMLADTFDSVTESNENNNYGSTPLTVTATLPDLVIERAPIVTPSTLEAGRDVRVGGVIRVRNQGLVRAGLFFNGYYLSDDSIITSSDQLLYLFSLGPLEAGAAAAGPSRDLTIPLSTTPGNYWIGMLVDSTNVVPELNENNNTAASPITVTIPLPDLLPRGALTVTPNPIVRPLPFLPATFTFGPILVQNSGLVLAGSFRVGFYLSTDSTISTTDTLLSSVPVNSIAPGTILNLGDRLLAIPLGRPPGTYWVGVMVDDTNRVFESNEGNNIDSLQVTLQ